MSSAPERSAPEPHGTALARQVRLFDATMLVIGGIVGAGIFMNPYVVARQVHTPLLILGAWAAGGVIALLGAFIWAELAAMKPEVGGQYAYLRDAYHPLLGFLYGWVLLLVTQTGGMAAVAVTFARYFLELTRWPLPDWTVAALAMALLTVINCAGIRPGAKVQSALTVLKISAIAALITAGLVFVFRGHAEAAPVSQWPDGSMARWRDSFSAFLAAMVPVLFAFGGWQTTNFVAAEIRDPRRNLPRALLYGVAGVVGLYLAVNAVCVFVLGAQGLAATTTPATAVMRIAWGATGAKVIALGIAVSTLGFLSQSILTAPRVYFAMAEDGVFFRTVAHVNPRTHVPDVAIVLQSVWTVVIALTGRYEQILNYVTAMDWVAFGMTATTLFVFRSRMAAANAAMAGERRGVNGSEHLFRSPGHPFTTILFVAAAFAVVANTIFRYPSNALIGFAILLAGIPVYYIWRRTK